MQLKITTDYAIRAIVYLAMCPQEIVPTSEVADAMKIPRKYLIQIGTVLKGAGLIESHPGKLGGYSLAKPPEQITMYDIVNVMEDTTRINRCLEEDAYCSRYATLCCPVRPIYTRLQDLWEKTLREATVASIVQSSNTAEKMGTTNKPPQVFCEAAVTQLTCGTPDEPDHFIWAK